MTVNTAWDDMTSNPDWIPYKDTKGFIKFEYLDKIPMFKVNNMRIEKVNNEGATVIDIGYPIGHDMSISGFYEMEKSMIKWN